MERSRLTGAMNDAVLYFPYINLPRSDWFARVLLYWDTVGCIIPGSYEPRLHRGTGRFAYTRELIDAGLVRPVHPDDAAGTIPDFVERFLAILDANPATPSAELDVRKATPVDIHIGKLGPTLVRKLAQRRLAVESVRGDWCPVEAKTADLFMAYLAGSLGALPENQMTPITDEIDYMRTFTHVPEAEVGAAESVQVREAILEAVLPAPAQTVTASDIADFKERHRDHLRRLRHQVEYDLREVALISDAAERSARTALLRDRLKDDLDEIVARMEEAGWRRLSLDAVATAAIVAETGMALAAGQRLLAAISLPVVIREVRELVGATRRDPEEPLAYAALAAKELAALP